MPSLKVLVVMAFWCGYNEACSVSKPTPEEAKMYMCKVDDEFEQFEIIFGNTHKMNRPIIFTNYNHRLVGLTFIKPLVSEVDKQS